jgi:hypothetical protein
MLPYCCCYLAATTQSFFSLAFKSTGMGSSDGGGGVVDNASHRRQQQHSLHSHSPPPTNNSGRISLSRSPITVLYHRESSCIVLHAAAEDDGVDTEKNQPPPLSSSPSAKKISLSSEDNVNDGDRRRFSAAPRDRAEILVFSGKNNDDDDVDVAATMTMTTTARTANPSSSDSGKAATSTVNERLLSEIQASLNREKFGSGISSSSKTREYFKEFRPQKSEEERLKSLEEARDLNGVNPLVCIGGAAFAWACAGALWALTTNLGIFFSMHPLDTDVYFVQRVAGVFRNVVVGLASLASGFFGVVGVGIFLLGMRVAYGVITGELDPTPIKTSKMVGTTKGEAGEEFVLPDAWDLMMGKKKRRRGGSDSDDTNRFGL